MPSSSSTHELGRYGQIEPDELEPVWRRHRSLTSESRRVSTRFVTASPGAATIRRVGHVASDSELLGSWRNGDRDAGRELFERYYPRLRRFFGNKVDDGVEDLIQATMLACVESRDRIQSDGKFRAYLFGTARNKLLLVYRSRKRDPKPLDTGVVCAQNFCTTPSMVLALRGDMRVLLAAMRRIPLDFQVLLELHYWEQMTTADLADMLGIPQSTVKYRLVRGRELLREQIEALRKSGHTTITVDDIESWARRVKAYADTEPAH